MIVEINNENGNITIGNKIKNGKQWGNTFQTYPPEEILKYGLTGMAVLNSNINLNLSYESGTHKFEVKISKKN